MNPENPNGPVILAGASCRALARSFVRAGYAPICFDLFADTDLAAVARVTPIALEKWPWGILDFLKTKTGIPFVFTGGLENHPEFLDKIIDLHPFWGNSPSVCRPVRDPFFLAGQLPPLGIGFPGVLPQGSLPPPETDWLLKPLAGSGGIGIRRSQKEAIIPRGFYAQKFLPGEDISFSFLLTPTGPTLLMVSRGLPPGGEWSDLLGAPGLGYLGNHLPGDDWQTVDPTWHQNLGNFLWKQGLRGLVGVDARIDGLGQISVLEINPRYTASMELTERSRNAPLAGFHAECFGAPQSKLPHASNFAKRGALPDPDNIPHTKAILYARSGFRFSPEIFWPEKFLDWELKHQIELCDLPPSGTVVAKGSPILTIMEKGTPWAKLKNRLGPIVEDLRDQLEHS